MLSWMKWGFVINRLSGGGQGRQLMAQLQAVWPGPLLCDLSQGTFEDWYAACNEPLEGLITAGGDGTIHWLSHAMRDWPQRPLLLPWPMGTGNDCAKFLGWPRQKPTQLAIQAIKDRLDSVVERLVDHWLITGPEWQRSLINYMSIGLDARIALAFDRGRKRAPYLHLSPEINKMAYAIHGLGARSTPIGHALRLNGESLPDWSCGLVWCNISSYAGGAVLSKSSDAHDGILDCHALGPLLTLASALGPWRQAHTLGRAAAYEFELSEPTAMQIDGEPLVAKPGVYTIQQCGTARFAVSAD